MTRNKHVARAERWGLVRAGDWDANGRKASVMPYRSSTAAGRSAGAQNKHVRRVGLPDDRLILVVRGRGDMWNTHWQVAYDPRDPARGAV
jgi:hypothetical protein